MIALVPGGNAPVTSGQVYVKIDYTPVPNADIDVSGFALGAAGKVRGDGDMCFYGQTRVLDSAIQMTESSAGLAVFVLDLSRLESGIDKVALTATIHENKASFDRVSRLSVSVGDDIVADIPTTGMQETALILGEIYRRAEGWKFRCVAQGFAGGLEPLAEHFGVEVAASAASTPPPPPPPQGKPSVNLSKVTLDKSRSSISLAKSTADFGEIKVNLNWHRGTSGGFFSRNRAIDLDVGCLFELKNGSKGVVQALGNAFGDLAYEPYIQLMGDDRTGSIDGGEWLHINGHKWSEIRRVLVYAFIYEGAPDWKQTDGVITIHMPDQPDIEVRLNEEGGRYGMCAIAMLENDNGAVKITRLVDFHKGHSYMDKAYGWGMRWSAGSK
ncbi:tellurite resistance protein TerA [Marinobacterium halophilum]|uniref:Tellurite resistance protein TerA n=1 Tax=Marinobacterium halophilum TaxID=267374 RepID=A0A2P8EYN1_9GAMM|nr:TerD family protein [Marinobacterium halophilum]PSL14573.1 tellurite resistance protein TerA [Marinobacterium halophilum]